MKFQELKKVYKGRTFGQIMQEAEDEAKKFWDLGVSSVKDLIHPKYIAFVESNDSYHHIEIIEIEKPFTRGNSKCCKVKSEYNDYLVYTETDGIVESFKEDSRYEGRRVRYWVHQETGILGDDYYGFLLLPLKDGRYWKVSYNC